MRFVVLVTLAAFVGCSSPEPAPEAPQKPNIVILLADDLGYEDVSFNGGDIKTPNIDRIAVEGAKLERFYVHPVCSPTRAGLMTGRYPIRYGSMKAVYPPWREGGLDTSEKTIADVLAKAPRPQKLRASLQALRHLRRVFGTSSAPPEPRRRRSTRRTRWKCCKLTRKSSRDGAAS